MKVIAKQLGFYNAKRRQVGEEFDLVPGRKRDDKGHVYSIPAENTFSDRWMHDKDGSVAKAKEAAAKAKAEAEAKAAEVKPTKESKK